jgi:hypothetical protein
LKKTLIYLVVFGLLGFGVWYLMFRNRDLFGVDEAGFNYKDTAAITKIFLTDKKGGSILLERSTDGWKMNNSFRVIPQVINGLLGTIAEQNASYPVPQTMHNTVIKILAGQSTKVELYGEEGKKLRVFYVGGQVSNNKGTYMLMEGAERPYVVQVQGFEGYIAPRYSTKIADWRDRAVFEIPQDALKSVAIQYPEEALNSFILFKDGNNLSVTGDSAIIKGKEFNRRRATVYSRFFEKIWCEGYINGVTALDSTIRSTQKYCIIDAVNTSGDTRHVEIYWMPINRRSKNLLTPKEGIPDQYDADRFYATINNFKDTVIIQRNIFEKLFRKAYEFYQPDDTSTVQESLPQNAGSFRKGH